MAMDADSFSLMVADPADFEGTRGRWRKRALYLCAANYQPRMRFCKDRGHAELSAIVRKQLKAEAKQEYGSVVLVFVLITVLGAAISWATSRLLSWLWPDKSSMPDAARLSLIRNLH